MNVYDAMGVLYDSAELPVGDSLVREAMSIVGSVVIAYDELEPTVEQWDAHPWAQWMTLFDNGKLIWWELEPGVRIMPDGECAWMEKDGRMGKTESGQVSQLPLGIDWRLCKWQRPEVLG